MQGVVLLQALNQTLDREPWYLANRVSYEGVVSWPWPDRPKSIVFDEIHSRGICHFCNILKIIHWNGWNMLYAVPTSGMRIGLIGWLFLLLLAFSLTGLRSSVCEGSLMDAMNIWFIMYDQIELGIWRITVHGIVNFDS